MLSSVLHVALGGAIGASLRHLTGIGVFRYFGPQEFPVAIILVNVIGSFVMGFFVVTAAHRGLKVAVIDAKNEPGARVRTTGILVKEAVDECDIPSSYTRPWTRDLPNVR